MTSSSTPHGLHAHVMHRRMVRRLLVLVRLMLLSVLALIPTVHAKEAPPLAQNDHQVLVGEPFFLLSDATYGSDESPRVRLELNAPWMLDNVGGVDMRVYRIQEPLDFLGKQRNLHRVQVPARPSVEGLPNTLTHLWDSWVVKSRMAWRGLFSSNARHTVTQEVPQLKTPPALDHPSTFEEPIAFRPIPGLPLVERFRYPVQYAQPIAPPKGVKLEGSSSDFIRPNEGNVHIPLKRLDPGLYLVEASTGRHRATTLLFISDTVAVNKISSAQMLVWSVQRQGGAAVAGTQVVWSDGVGTLASGRTDARGLLRLDHRAPEQSYVFGLDPKGGVFISENFYEDSEIHATKLYTVTDRPLYRPGDEVKIKVSGREFKNARDSVALADGEIALQALDPAGQVVATRKLAFFGGPNGSGADGAFRLPDNAVAGGYELRLTLRDAVYAAAFRVAEYQKPHFEISWLPDQADLATGQAVTGRLRLTYPDGKPVSGARLSLSARAQGLSMIEGELGDSGAFPLKVAQDELLTDKQGFAPYSLPAAEQPSRYILSVLATDGAAYRVRGTREILIERGANAWHLGAERQFSNPRERVTFTWQPSRQGVAPANPPARWSWVRLEDRSHAEGSLDDPAQQAQQLGLRFEQPGSYSVTLRDERGRIVAAASHWVSGDGLKAPAGGISIVFDRPSYRAGDTAEALVSFPEPVEHALLSLERDKVEAAALLAQGGEGLRAERLGLAQWKVRIKVSEAMQPNITFSVAYVHHGEMVFENQGLRVQQPHIAIDFKPERPRYAPGELVNIDVSTTLGGQPVSADVAVSVVDEMIYVLQPEIAPNIEDFFNHLRRNNVRTQASLSFIGYDLATRALGQVPKRRAVQERALKVLERPRRDEVDTAAWVPRLHTDANGRARLSFRMPDALTRWRITGRAIEPGGHVGQQTAWVQSHKDFFVTWTSPDWQRVGDTTQASVALFNQLPQEAEVTWSVSGTSGISGVEGLSRSATLKLQPGPNFVTLPLSADQVGTQLLTLSLKRNGVLVDSLQSKLRRLPVARMAARERVLDLSNGGPGTLSLAADPQRIRVTLASDPAAAAFNRWVDELVEFPYGCVEQTASRMLPLALALSSLSAAQMNLAPMLTQRLTTARLALAQMAGPEARFGWWGRGMPEDAFLTTYAYYADWRASQALRLSLPAEHWQRLLTVYAKGGASAPPLQRALMLHWMRAMGLPVSSLSAALLEDLAKRQTGQAAQTAHAKGGATPAPLGIHSLVFSDESPSSTQALDMAWVLAVMDTSQRPGQTPDAALRAQTNAAMARLNDVPSPLVQSLLVLARQGGSAQANALLAKVRGDQPSFDRAQALMWLHQALGGGAAPELRVAPNALSAPWVPTQGSVGQTQWTLPAGTPLPLTLQPSPNSGAKVAYISYESAESPSAATLPVQIERRLYKVISLPSAQKDPQAQPESQGQGRMSVRLEAVPNGAALDTNTLYLDELRVRPERRMRWALLEAALPPGAAVEASTWGLDLLGSDGKTSALERAVHQNTAQGYAVPIERLQVGKPLVFRHLLRFAQRGSYVLPPAQLYRMYEPEARAVEGSYGNGTRWTRVEVR
ncbi:MAG: alpha-2-macroglobulin family protein [Leptothrix ochracea]|uniref:MG2 domain-containing protein n=1 Tax=Leptothrix ochracea TaxID=735331 RepID=UPI0034E2C837